MGCCLLTPVPRTAAILHKEARIRGTTVRVAFGDITSEHVDAVINICDPIMSLRAGVPGAIKRNAGLEVAKECESAASKAGTPLPLGHTIVTGAGHMPCRRIIHVVGPAHWDDTATSDVKSAVLAALAKAEELHCMSVSLPGTCAATNLSCAHSVASALSDWLQTTDTSLREARLVSWDSEVVKAFEGALAGQGTKKDDTPQLTSLPRLHRLPQSMPSTPELVKKRKSRRGVGSLEKDIKQAIKGQCIRLSLLQQGSTAAVKKALCFLQLREEGCTQASAIGLSNKMRHTDRALAPRFRPYIEKDDYINYEAIEAAYRRFEQRHVVINGMVHNRDEKRIYSEAPSPH